MIDVSISTALFIYLAAWLLTITILWLRELWRIRKNDWQLSNGNVFQCNHCYYSFVSRESANTIRCPRCNAICFRPKGRF
ncbi:MAG: hypothetical protein MST10_07985 [Lentisphaeria bacterium]|nr:hypothetical protein [Lentisphaeria bacterium]